MTHYRKPWTRQELILALDLYRRIPFGQLSQMNPEVNRVIPAHA